MRPSQLSAGESPYRFQEPRGANLGALLVLRSSVGLPRHRIIARPLSRATQTCRQRCGEMSNHADQSAGVWGTIGMALADAKSATLFSGTLLCDFKRRSAEGSLSASDANLKPSAALSSKEIASSLI